MKHLLTYFKNIDPSSSENIGSGYSLGQEWYNTITGDKFYHKFDGVWTNSLSDSSSTIIEVTYSELTALVAGSNLIPGRVYLLTDYMTVYEQPVSGDTISSGVVEPLYITAASENGLNNVCMSQLYPQDVVYYEITGDINNGYGTEGFTKGKIYRRIDTIYNNDIGTDWRHVKYRRYKLNVINEYTVSDSYVIGDVVFSGSGIYICVEDDPSSSTISSKKWLRYLYDKETYRSVGILNTTIDLYNGETSIISCAEGEYQDYLLFYDGVSYSSGDVYNNFIATYNLSNNVVYDRFSNNIINTNRFLSNNIGLAERNNINFAFSENNIDAFIGNTIDGSVSSTGFNRNHIKDLQGCYINSTFRLNCIVGNFRWNTIERDFNGNTILDNWNNNNIGEYVQSNLITGIFNNVNISYNFLENIIRRPFTSCNFNGYFRYFDIPEIFPETTISYWNFNGTLDGSGISLPAVSDSYLPTMYKSANIVLVRYDDEYGDTIILGQPETFSFRSNQEPFNISVNTAASTKIRIDWGDGAVWTSSTNTSFTTDNTYTGKANTDEYVVSVGGVNITTINIPSNQITYFNTDNLPGTLQYLYLNNNLLTSFDPSIALPSTLQYLYLNNNLLTSFDPSIALPNSLQTLELQSNLLTSFDPVNHALPNSIQNLQLGDNQLTSFDPSIELPSSLSGLLLYDNLLTSFDPSIELPSALLALNLSSNQLTSFDPVNFALPSTLQSLGLSSNLLASFDPVNFALPSTLQTLGLDNNQLTSFDPVNFALPSTLQTLGLDNNQLTSFDPVNFALPSSLTSLNLYNNQLTSFDPVNFALPSSLAVLLLYDNLLTSFDPSIALPSSLQQLNLNSNQLTSFDPVNFALPSSLTQLRIRGPQLTTFNPTLPLPSTLNTLDLYGNQLNTTQVNNTLVLLNTTYTTSGYKFFDLRMSPSAPPSGAGLAAKSTLMARGYSVLTD
jgi:Leucine-rich repeat (LRR) protein